MVEIGTCGFGSEVDRDTCENLLGRSARGGSVVEIGTCGFVSEVDREIGEKLSGGVAREEVGSLVVIGSC